MSFDSKSASRKFASRLRQLRDKAGLSQTDLARELNVSRGAISYYENEDRIPNIEFLVDISKYFDVPADYLLGLTDDPNRMPAATDELGLTEKAIKNLQGIKKYGPTIDQNAINKILECATLWNFFVPEGSEWTDQGADVLHAIAMYLAQEQNENSAIFVIPSDGNKAQEITFDDKLRFLPQNYDVPIEHLARKALLDLVCKALNEMKDENG